MLELLTKEDVIVVKDKNFNRGKEKTDDQY